MRHITKKLADVQPAVFRQWKTENGPKIQEWTADATKTGEQIWGQLGKTFGAEMMTEIDPKFLKKALETALFEEQFGLCCYCGDRLGRHTGVEHFRAKNKAEYKKLIFDYGNLLFCCREDRRLKVYEIGRTSHGEPILDFASVEKLTGIPQSLLKYHEKNRPLAGRPLKRGDKIHAPNPPHCDVSKSGYDSRQAETEIIDPANDAELIGLLTFNETGIVGCAETGNKKVEDTFRVLALNCETLVERRKKKWADVFLEYFDEGVGVLAGIEDATKLQTTISKLLTGKSTPNAEGLLEPFFFVEIAFLKSLSNG